MSSLSLNFATIEKDKKNKLKTANESRGRRTRFAASPVRQLAALHADTSTDAGDERRRGLRARSHLLPRVSAVRSPSPRVPLAARRRAACVKKVSR